MSLRGRWLQVRGVVRGLSECELAADPLVQFDHWLADARHARLPLPEAFMLATASPDGRPSVRGMLYKGRDDAGFFFYTNYESRKARELEANPHAAMVFHWNILERQVRIEGRARRATTEQSAAYFKTRSRGSRIGAWASRQSAELSGREELEARVRELNKRFQGQDVPLPPFWGGYHLIPERIEFWQGRVNRLHDRLCYLREGEGWRIVRLSP